MFVSKTTMIAALVTSTVLLPSAVEGSDPPSVYLGKLTDFLFCFFDGSHNAGWDGGYVDSSLVEGGYAGDIMVNGYAGFSKAYNLAYEGTIYSSAPTNNDDISDWKQAIQDNPSQSEVTYGQVALLHILEDDFNLAMGEICALDVTSGYESVDMASYAAYSIANNGTVHPDFNFTNGVADQIIIDVDRDTMTVDEYIYISGDAEDLIIFRWGTHRNTDGSCIYKGKVLFKAEAGVIPTGGLTPDRLIHAAGNLGSHMSGQDDVIAGNPLDHLPAFPVNELDEQVAGSNPWGRANFFVGYWLTTGDHYGADQHETADLFHAVFVGGWYTTTTRFSVEKGGVHVPQKFKVEDEDLFDVSMSCQRNINNPCYAEDDFRGIALISLAKALTISVYEGNGPGSVNPGNHTTNSTGTSSTRKLLRGGALQNIGLERKLTNNCHFCLPEMCVAYGCRRRRRELKQATMDLELLDDPAERKQLLLSMARKDTQGRGRAHRFLSANQTAMADDQLDFTEVEYPVVKEHHAMTTLFDHYGYALSPEQSTCIAETYCTLTYVMYPQEESA